MTWMLLDVPKLNGLGNPKAPRKRQTTREALTPRFEFCSGEIDAQLVEFALICLNSSEIQHWLSTFDQETRLPRD